MMPVAGDWMLWSMLWLVPVAVLVAWAWTASGRSVGLLLGYGTAMWLIHWPAAAIQALPWMPSIGPAEVFAGFRLSTVGIWAFTLGGVVLAPLLAMALHRGERRRPSPPARPSDRLPGIYLGVGVLSYVVLLPLGRFVPGFSALGSAMSLLIVAGLALKSWTAFHRGERLRALAWLACGAMLPLLTLVSVGFVGYGAGAFMALVAFATVFVRPRKHVFVLLAIVGYVGFSFYVTYMRDRGAIRSVVWGGAAAPQRVEAISGILTDFEWFDLRDVTHLRQIDARLNQNFLAGAAVKQMEAGLSRLAFGETLWRAAAAVVPRALWPDKPVAGGSGDLVSRFTGIGFAEGTSVGIGQVMEFYVNFGPVGVVVGFLIMGLALGLLDRAGGVRLWRGDWEGFAVFMVAGLAALQPGGSLVDVAGSVMGALVGVTAVNRLLLPFLDRRPQPLPPPVGEPVVEPPGAP